MRVKPAVGCFDKRGKQPKVSVQFPPDMFSEIQSWAHDNEQSFGSGVRFFVEKGMSLKEPPE